MIACALQVVRPGANALGMLDTPVAVLFRKSVCCSKTALAVCVERFLWPALNLQKLHQHFPLKLALCISE